MSDFFISSNKYSLQERQTKRGKVYDVVFRVVTMDGYEKQKKLSGYATKNLAKQAYLEFVSEKCELLKNNPLKKKNYQKEEPTVGELVLKYMSTLGNINKNSVIYDKNNLFRKYILSEFNDTKIRELTKERLYLWQDNLWSLKNEKTNAFFSNKYLTKIRSLFNTFLTWVEKRYSYVNNLSLIDKPISKKTKKEFNIWTREEFEQFISVVKDQTYHTFFTFAFYMGARKGELLALFPEDVKEKSISISKSVNRRKLGGKTWEITSTKEDKTSTLPVCEIIQNEIKNYKKNVKGKFYFGGDEPLALTTLQRHFERYILLSGVKRIRIHDLRHSFVSMLIHYGANVMVVADLINDSVEQVIKTYGHLYQEDKLNVLSKITQINHKILQDCY